MNSIVYRNGSGDRHRAGGLPAVEDVDIGAKEWWVNGLRHRKGGLPAVENANGDKEWWVNGQRHREGGLPAIEYADDGSKSWYVNGQLHREGGLPAVVWSGGTKSWYVNGHRHREGGLPAVELVNGTKSWWLCGRKLSDDKVIAYTSFCKKMVEKKRIVAEKKIYFWWIQICYDLEHPSGCGKRMALKNLEEFENMMKT